MYEMVIQLNDEGEGMQSTILALQQELKDKQQEITRLTYAGDNKDAIPNPAPDVPELSDAVTADVKNEMEMDHDGQLDMQSNNMLSDMQPDFSEAGDPQEPYPEPMEQGEATEQEREEPAVRTTEYGEEIATPVESKEDVPEDISVNNNFSRESRDNLSVEAGINQTTFAESPASPIRVEDERTSEGPRLADAEYRTAEADANYTREPTDAEFRTEVEADASSEATLEEQATGEETELPQGFYRDGDSPERTSESARQEAREEAVSEDGYGREEGSRDFGENREVAEVYYRQEEPQFRTPVDETSQDSTLSGGARDVDTDDSSRTGQRSESLTPDISTNGESHSEAAPYAAASNGEAQPLCVNNDYGREGVNVERSTENVSSTLVEDRSTLETIGGEGESNSLDNGSSVTDNQSTEVVPDNNGMCDPGECINSGLSSPLEDEVPPLTDGEVTRTNNLVKSLRSNSHEESPRGPESEQCVDEQDTVDQNSVPSTNSNAEEISV